MVVLQRGCFLLLFFDQGDAIPQFEPWMWRQWSQPLACVLFLGFRVFLCFVIILINAVCIWIQLSLNSKFSATQSELSGFTLDIPQTNSRCIPPKTKWHFLWISLQETTSLPVQQSSRLVNVNTEPKEVASNVQRDQSAPLHQEQSPPELLETFDGLPSLPTDTPFTSYPVTKSPGSLNPLKARV